MLPAPLNLFFFQSENVIRADLVVSAQSDKMVYRELVCAALIARVHSLRGAEKVCYFFLRFITVFAQVAYAFYIRYGKPSSLEICFLVYYIK